MSRDKFIAVSRRLRLGIWLALALMLSACSGRPPDEISTLRSADLVVDGEARHTVTLPHSREPSKGDSTGTEYRFSLPSGKTDRIGVFVTVSTVPFVATVNGTAVFQNGDAGSPSIPYGSWRASPWFWVAPTDLTDGPNELVLRMFDRRDAGAVLGPVLVGPGERIERWAIRQLVLHHFLPVLIGAMLVGVGIIALALGRGRRDRFLFLLFASGTLLWGLQTLLVQMPSRLVPMPHYSVVVLSAYVWYPMLIAVFFTRFAYRQSRVFETAAAILAASAAPLLYLGLAYGVLQPVSIALRAAVLIAISVALAAVVRFAWQRRDPTSMLLLAAGTACVAFAARDYFVTLGPSDGRTMLWSIYSGLTLVVLAGWMLV